MNRIDCKRNVISLECKHIMTIVTIFRINNMNILKNKIIKKYNIYRVKVKKQLKKYKEFIKRKRIFCKKSWVKILLLMFIMQKLINICNKGITLWKKR
jgi:hypothetical protein